MEAQMADEKAYVPKTETIMTLLGFEGEHKVPVSFTQVGDHVIMTVKSWSMTRQNGTRTFIFLDLPEKFRPVSEHATMAIVYNGGRTQGLVIIKPNIILIHPTELCNDMYFNASGKVGFPQFTVTYSLK